MDERIGMQHLQRSAHVFNSIRNASRYCASGFNAKNRADSLSSGKNTVPHRSVD